MWSATGTAANTGTCILMVYQLLVENSLKKRVIGSEVFLREKNTESVNLDFILFSICFTILAALAYLRFKKGDFPKI